MNMKLKAFGLGGLVLIVALSVACGGGGGSDSSGGGGAEPAASAPATSTPAQTGSPAPTGSASIMGTVTFEGDAPTMKALSMAADPDCAKKHTEPVLAEALVLGEGNTMGNIFVRVIGGLPDGSYATPSEPVVMDQRGCRYIPHVMGVMVNQPFKILNSDGVLHNVHSLSSVNSQFNKAMPGSVMESMETFTRVEDMFKIKCDVHPWMEAYVGVVGHPYFDVTAEDGKYEITGLPAGTYEIEVWQEKLKTQTASVTVADGESAAQDFTYSR